MENFVHEALTIEAVVKDTSAIQLTWRGTSRSRDPAKTLSPYLANAISWAAKQKAALEMRFDALDFFNSATVMAIIKSSHLARASGVRMRLLYARDIEWQKLSFDPMRVFQKDDGLFEIVPLGAGAGAPS